MAEERARQLLAQAEQEFRDYDLLDDELHAVLMVGTHTSNGWVAELNGRRTLFLALEYLGEPPCDDLLVVHELSHVVQGQRSPAARASTYASSRAVMLEGAATATSRVLRTGRSDSAYLWMDEHHQAWVHDCHGSSRMLARHLMQHHDVPDDHDVVAPHFRNQTREGIPPRSGYWVGDQIAQGILEQGTDIGSLLSITPEQARSDVLDWARAHAG
ncbi:hypothetical protein [Arthrobacter sp. NEB 688]|uniref:hypothetical protein n=1 Tax=Arthrobacter sp. NEB 688 TaxID=904039 RepID=UPI001563AE43|nr:hypothetical protein [Arthrobacter sp. NEB 688]QKE85150.1 hypothetical protein HL663_15200 [Arthrobacter sp. NEB 688]